MAQFAGRLQCDVDPKLQTLCQTLTQTTDFETLPKERVLIELEKGWLKSVRPEVAIKWMVELRALPRYISIFDTFSAEQWKRTYNRIQHAASLRPTVSKGHSMGLFWAMLTFELQRSIDFLFLTILTLNDFMVSRFARHLLNWTHW